MSLKSPLMTLLACLSLSACADQASRHQSPSGASESDSDDSSQGLPCDAPMTTLCHKAQKTCLVDMQGEARCELCPPGQHPTLPSGACVATPGTVYAHDFPTQELAPGEEIGSLCVSWILNNETELWVNAVEFENGGGYHHSNWFFVPQDHLGWPTEPWLNCNREGFNTIDAALAGGVLYAQTTQTTRELQRFVDGAAVRIPPYSRIIAATHLLNYQPTTLVTEMKLRFYAIDPAEVSAKLTPFQLIYNPLDIPPKSESIFETQCELKAYYEGLFKEPFAMKLHYLLPHYHELANLFQVALSGGERDGELLIDQQGLGNEPGGRVFDPPLDLNVSDGLTMRCGYLNPRDERVVWGIGDQEMCQLLGFVESKMAFSGGPETNEVVGESEGVVLNSGECKVTGFGFSQAKPGGGPTEP